MTVYRSKYKTTVRRIRLEKKQEWESHRTVLEGLRRCKEQQKQQQSQEEQDASYAQMLQDFEWT